MQGHSVVQSYDRIHTFIAEELGNEHAALFAEPNLDPSRGVTDWYAEPSGNVLNFVDADEASKQSAKDHLEKLFNEISKQLKI